jgi:antitoxin MazE
MVLKIIRVGNSKGLRLPKILLDEYGFQDEVEVYLKADSIEIKPAHIPREAWYEELRDLSEKESDELLIPDVFEDEDI